MIVEHDHCSDVLNESGRVEDCSMMTLIRYNRRSWNHIPLLLLGGLRREEKRGKEKKRSGNKYRMGETALARSTSKVYLPT